MDIGNNKIISLLAEIRKRIITIFVVVFTASVISYFFRAQLWRFIEGPYLKIRGKEDLIFITPAEAFFNNIKISVVGGMFFSAPFIFYQAISLLTHFAKGKTINILFTSFISFFLFILGMLFSYFMVIPFALRFFLKFESELLIAQWTVGRYLSFFLWMLFSFGLIFELPVVVFFLNKFNIVNAGILKSNRKYIILIIFVIAGFLSPGPDVISQILIAVPLIILNEISIFVTSLGIYNK